MKHFFCFKSLFVAAILIVGVSVNGGVKAQLQVQLGTSHAGWTPDSLVRNVLLGSGVEIYNVRLNGNQNSIACTGVGTFTTGNNSTGIGISEGIILSACAADYVAGVSGSSDVHSCNTYSDPTLSTLTTEDLNNVMVLEFDFVPKSDSVKFRYVFASEEYASYTCSEYNDIFAFFLSGPNPGGGVYANYNIARIPGTELPITINSVNSGSPSGGYPASGCTSLAYSQYFNSTFNPSYIQHMTGATTILTAEAKVFPCQNYHLKMAIANVSDQMLPSVVFLEANSLMSNAIDFDFVNAANPNAPSDLYEGCQAVIKMTRPQAVPYNTRIDIDFSGTATNGVDFSAINPYFYFPAGQTVDSLVIAPYIDPNAEGLETAKFVLSAQGGCPRADSVTFNIMDVDPISVTIEHDTLTSATFNTWLRANIEGGMPNRTVYWTDLMGGNNPNRTGDSIFVSTVTDSRWVAEVRDACGNTALDTMLVGIRRSFAYVLRDEYGSAPFATLAIRDTMICAEDSVTLYMYGADSCVWYISGQSQPFNTSSTQLTVNPSEDVVYRIHSYQLWNGQYWEDVDSVRFFVVPLPEIGVSASKERICKGGSTVLTAMGTNNFSWDGGVTFSTDIQHTVMPDTTTMYYVLGRTNGAECYASDSILIVVDTIPDIVFDDGGGVCGGENAELLVYTSAEHFTWSANPPDPSLGGQESHNHIIVNPSVSTVYTVNAVNGVCTNSKSTTVSVEQMPVAIAEVSPKTVSLGQMEATFIDVSKNSVTRKWEFPFGVEKTEKEVSYVVPDDVDSITVKLWAYNAYDCFDTTRVTVYVDHTTLWAPNAFTPEESTNNTFLVKYNDIQRFHILIYDRRGQLVFESYDPEKPWDGKYQNGKKCPQGVYTYLISCHKITYPYDQIISKGTVLLLR